MPAYYDVVLANSREYFSIRVMELCAQFDLSFFLVEPHWVADFLRQVEEGEIRVRVYIDMGSDAYEAGNLYFKLAKELKKTCKHMIDDPDRVAIVGHKGLFHRMLIENNIQVPETLIVLRKELESFRITEEIKTRVGVPFVVKPGWGGARVGVILNAMSETDLQRSAQATPYSDTFLIQEKVEPKPLDQRVGWFRVFYIFGEVIPCWWEPRNNRYQLVSPRQRRKYKLGPLMKIVRDIARVSKISFFSTEIAITHDDRFLAIDYLNTGVDMHAMSYWPTGVPDELVRHIAWRLVDHSLAVVRRHRGPFDEELEMKDQTWDELRAQSRLTPDDEAL